MRSTKNWMSEVIVIGGGAAGLMTAVKAAERGLTVAVIEPNSRMGKKLRITGKGRCNVTNNCEPQEFLKNVYTNPRFLKGALYAFPPSAVIDFFEAAGVPLKTERGNRVFPLSDRAGDIADALEKLSKSKNVRFIRDSVSEILTENGRVTGVRGREKTYDCRAAVICTGGLSYPATGSTGEGYGLAEKLGHTVIAPRASLVPVEAEAVCGEMQGLSLRNVTLSLYKGDKLLYRELGEMLFTHFGVSGPLVLSASAYLTGDVRDYRMVLDLKPGLSEDKLDERILRDFAESKNRDFINSLDALLPQKMIDIIVRRCGIPPRTKVNIITREQRQKLLYTIKNFDIKLYGLRPIEEAIITAGGIDTKEVNPRTMESKLISGLYFAGEILNLDACTGGYNLQIAWSTANAAARAIPLEDANE